MYVTFPIQLNCIVICSAFCSGDEMNQFLASRVIDTCQNIKTDMLSMAFSCSIIYDSVLMSSLKALEAECILLIRLSFCLALQKFLV